MISVAPVCRPCFIGDAGFVEPVALAMFSTIRSMASEGNASRCCRVAHPSVFHPRGSGALTTAESNPHQAGRCPVSGGGLD